MLGPIPDFLGMSCEGFSCEGLSCERPWVLARDFMVHVKKHLIMELNQMLTKSIPSSLRVFKQAELNNVS